jgi:hypothetical protein
LPTGSGSGFTLRFRRRRQKLSTPVDKKVDLSFESSIPKKETLSFESFAKNRPPGNEGYGVGKANPAGRLNKCNEFN